MATIDNRTEDEIEISGVVEGDEINEILSKLTDELLVYSGNSSSGSKITKWNM